MGYLALLVVCASPPGDLFIEDSVDRIDYNTVYTVSEDGDYHPRFNQVIFWDMYPDGEYHVREWRNWGGVYGVGSWPVKQGSVYILDWHDPKTNFRRRTVAEVFIRTHTSFDPEIEDKMFLRQDERIRFKGKSKEFELWSRD